MEDDPTPIDSRRGARPRRVARTGIRGPARTPAPAASWTKAPGCGSSDPAGSHTARRGTRIVSENVPTQAAPSSAETEVLEAEELTLEAEELTLEPTSTGSSTDGDRDRGRAACGPFPHTCRVIPVPASHRLSLALRRHSSAVEQLFRKQQVLGSNPSVGSMNPRSRPRGSGLPRPHWPLRDP